MSAHPEAVTIAKAMMASTRIRDAVDQCIKRSKLYRNLKWGVVGEDGEFWAASVFAMAFSTASINQAIQHFEGFRKRKKAEAAKIRRSKMSSFERSAEYQKRKAYHCARSEKKKEAARIRRQQRMLRKASGLKKVYRRRRHPFAAVGKNGGSLSPHHMCIPCFSCLGASRKRISELTGIDLNTLKAHGFAALSMEDRIALAHAGKRLIYEKLRKAQKHPNDIAIIEMEIRKERRECRRIDRMWEKHPETKRWEGRMSASRLWERWKHDPQFRIAKACRSRIWKFLNGSTKRERTHELLGCSFEQLAQWLESKFQPGMSWENYGDWEIDHVIPCAAFDLTDRQQRLKCFHYTNTQPMWWRENIVKGSSYNGRKHRHVGL